VWLIYEFGVMLVGCKLCEVLFYGDYFVFWVEVLFFVVDCVYYVESVVWFLFEDGEIVVSDWFVDLFVVY